MKESVVNMNINERREQQITKENLTMILAYLHRGFQEAYLFHCTRRLQSQSTSVELDPSSWHLVKPLFILASFFVDVRYLRKSSILQFLPFPLQTLREKGLLLRFAGCRFAEKEYNHTTSLKVYLITTLAHQQTPKRMGVGCEVSCRMAEYRPRFGLKTHGPARGLGQRSELGLLRCSGVARVVVASWKGVSLHHSMFSCGITMRGALRVPSVLSRQYSGMCAFISSSYPPLG